MHFIGNALHPALIFQDRDQRVFIVFCSQRHKACESVIAYRIGIQAAFFLRAQRQVRRLSLKHRNLLLPVQQNWRLSE